MPTCDIYRAGNTPPAAPDVTGNITITPAFEQGREMGESEATGLRFTNIGWTALATDIRDGQDAFTPGNGDTIYVPDRNGLGYAVRFVEKVGLVRKVYLDRKLPNWPWPVLVGPGGGATSSHPGGVNVGGQADWNATTAGVTTLIVSGGIEVGGQATLTFTAASSALRGFWKLDEGSGSIAHDTSSYQHDGTNYGSWATDVPSSTGYSYSAQCGTYGYINVLYSSDWALDGDFTIGCWVKYSSVDNSIFMSHDTGGGDLPKWILGYWSGTLNFHFYGTGSNAGGQYPIAYSWSPGTGNWHHIVITRSGSDYKLYLDGSNVQTGTDSHAFPTPAQLSSAALQFGVAEGVFYLNGKLSDVRIYHQTLTGTQVANWYESGNP